MVRGRFLAGNDPDQLLLFRGFPAIRFSGPLEWHSASASERCEYAHIGFIYGLTMCISTCNVIYDESKCFASAMRKTRKLEALLELIRSGEGERGIYALAAAAGRPYRRVHDQVRRLAATGLVRLEAGPQGRRITRVLPTTPAEKPTLAFDRAWSRPSGNLPPDTVIAQVLARPTFQDLLACVQYYGADRVHSIYEDMVKALELAPGAAAASNRILNNIEIGRARAA